MEEFKIEDLSNRYKNINHKPCNIAGYDYAFNLSESKGEIYYSVEDKELWVLKDNYPMPRRAFRTTFPIKTWKEFESLFESIKLNLNKNIIVKKESRCCGRCNGQNDICVADQICEMHKEQGCELCFGSK